MSVVVSLVLAVFLIGLYFVPTMVAADRKNHTAAVFALNLFLGWTLLGWVVALVMALWANHAKDGGVASGHHSA